MLMLICRQSYNELGKNANFREVFLLIGLIRRIGRIGPIRPIRPIRLIIIMNAREEGLRLVLSYRIDIASGVHNGLDLNVLCLGEHGLHVALQAMPREFEHGFLTCP